MNFKTSKLSFITSLGSGLEYYSFIIFAMQADLLSKLFFYANPRYALIETFAVFSLGSFVMPLGGFLMGWVGDWIGRKNILLFSISLMAISTFLIGCLPEHTNYPGFIIAALVLFRIMQGLSQGTELPGAITFICEHAEAQNRAFSCGVLFLGVGLGAALGTFVSFLVSHYFSEAEIAAYAWRFPFWFSIVLGFVGFWLRRKTSESPEFLRVQAAGFSAKLDKKSLLLTIKKLLHGAGLVWFGAVLVSLGLFLPAYLSQQFHYAQSDVYLSTMIGFLSTAFFLPIIGMLADRYGLKKIYLWGVVLTLFSLPILFWNLKNGYAAYLYFFNIVYYFLIVMMASCYPTMLTQLFPTRIRFRCVALSYAGAFSLGGLVPILASFLILHFAPLSVLWPLLISGVVSLAAGVLYNQKSTNDILPL